MAVKFCPHCETPLTKDEEGGRRCPACEQPLRGWRTAAESAAPAEPRPRSKGSPGAAAARGVLTVALLIAGVSYTGFQAVNLVAPEIVSQDDTLPAGEAKAMAAGQLAGRVAGLTIGAVFSFVLFRSLLSRTFAGPRHRGFAFTARACLAILLLVVGGVMVTAGWDPPKSRTADKNLRAGGVLALLGAAIVLTAALGRKPVFGKRVVAALAEDEDGEGA